jgi:uncharacterized membrane protein
MISPVAESRQSNSPPKAWTRIQDRVSSLWSWVDGHHRALLVLLLVGYFVLFSAGSIYKLETLRQGFDLAGNEQTIWNTMHGRFFRTSVFALMDYDFDDGPVLLQLPLAVLYAIYPSTYTLLVLQTLAIVLGALPLFWLGRDLWGRPSAGLVAASLYLLHPTVQTINLYEFQYRSFSMCFALFAFYFFEKRRWWLWALFLFLAMATKTESALLVIVFGLYALLRRRRWDWVVPPVLAGAAWFYVALFVVVPHFTKGGDSFVGSIYSYGFLGDSFGEVIRNMVTRPFFVLQQILQPAKVRFLLTVFFLSGFLPLLSPMELLLAAPIFFINLISPNRVQFSIYYQYQGLTVPFLIVGSLYGLHRLQGWLHNHRGWGRQQFLNLAMFFLVLFALVNCALWRNALLTTLRNGDTRARIRDARAVVALVPEDVPVAASSFLAPFVARRQGVFFFPGNRSYPEEYIAKAEYILTDTSKYLSERGHELLEEYLRNDEWVVLAEEGDFLLLWRAGVDGGEWGVTSIE